MSRAIRTRAAVLFGAAVLWAACGEAAEEVEGPGLLEEVEPLNPPDGATTMESAAGLEVVRVGTFEPAAAAAGPIDGHVQLKIPPVGEPQGLHVDVRVEGLSQGPHAWHIHSGSCAGPAAPVVVAFTPTPELPGLDEPLVPGPDGVAEEAAFVPESTLSREQIAAGEYSVHVHRQGGTEHGPTVACADL